MMGKHKKVSLPKKEETVTREDIKKLVLARMMAIPSNVSLSIGSSDYSVEDLTKHVQKGDKLGEQVIRMQMEFLRDMASGAYETEDEQ